MKKIIYILCLLLTIAALFILTPRDADEFSAYSETTSHLKQPQRNIVIIALNLEDNNLNIRNINDASKIEEFNQKLKDIKGVNKVDSILNAKVIKPQGDDEIEVKTYYPGTFDDLDEFPELMAYVSSDAKSLLFYIYFGYKVTPNTIYNSIEEIYNEGDFKFSYTGKSPINAITEKLISSDILILFPILFIGVLIIFLSFRRVKAIISAWIVIVLSVTASFLLIKYLGISITPMVLLVPVFSLGLLSDYIIHYIYHLFYAPHNDDAFTVRRSLIYPLGLTALSTLTGFLSLVFINASGHTLLGSIIAVAVVFTFIGVMFWLPYLKYKRPEKDLLPRFSHWQITLFEKLYNKRKVLYVILSIGIIWGSITLPRLQIEPYPLEQLPDNSTIKRAENLINSDFFGGMPFFIEIDTGRAGGFLEKDTLLEVEEIHKNLNRSEEVGYSYSLLTVLKRINYYFRGDEESLLGSNEYDDMYSTLIEQFLLYYSSSVDPLEYESQVDSSFRYFSIKGYLKYKNVDSLNSFRDNIDSIEESLPEGWKIDIHGVIKDLEREKTGLTQNWIISFAIGCLLIFATVLIFYRKIKLALLSLVPGFISMILSFGIIGTMGIRIDSFSIIFVAIITGLVIDYSIHTLAALDKMPKISSIKEGFTYINHYSGIPIFLSFLTSLFSFSVLFLSKFKGARSLGILLFASLIISYILSFYLLPIVILPNKVSKAGRDKDGQNLPGRRFRSASLSNQGEKK